jgi:hypothetical protein
MLAKTLLAMTSLVASTMAAPLEARTAPPVPANTFAPTALYSYDVGTGAIGAASSWAVVDKYTSNGGHDSTTLMTFTYPNAAEGKQCALYFYSNPDTQMSWTGSERLDIFSSNSPAPGKTSGWGPGNQRNNHLGRWKKSGSAWADWEATYGGLSVAQPCKPAGTYESFEIVGVWDNDHVSYDNAFSGVRIAYW